MTSTPAALARSIIARNASPDIPFEQSVNPYRGCEHGCIYCYARPSHAYLELSPGLDFETKLFAKSNAAELLKGELSKKGYLAKPIAFGTNTDCYQPLEAARVPPKLAPAAKRGRLGSLFQLGIVLGIFLTLFINARKRIIDLATKQRIPVVGHRSEFVDDQGHRALIDAARAAATARSACRTARGSAACTRSSRRSCCGTSSTTSR